MQKEYLKIALGEAFFASPQILKSLAVKSSQPAPEKFGVGGCEDARVADSGKIEDAQLADSSSTKDSAEMLTQIRAEIGDCTRCKLCSTRKNIVYGKGSAHAPVMFVGEGPGEQEDLQGLPFVGKAGQLLDKIIQAMGFHLENVYIANVVKCRPPGNRTPEPDEVSACRGFLEKQIHAVQPKIIVALGSSALQCLVGESARITKMRGKIIDYAGLSRKIPLMPTFHPSYLLRNPDAKKDVWTDMKQVLEFLKTV